MSKLLDKICFMRDLLASKQYEKLKFYKMKMYELKDEIHRQIKKKTTDYSYELDFTAQDLRELAQDIRSLLKRWETAMCPEKNTKALLKEIEDGQINLNPLYEKTLPVMVARTENIQPLTELLNLIEYHAVFLYMVELAADDKIAVNFTERL